MRRSRPSSPRNPNWKLPSNQVIPDKKKASSLTRPQSGYLTEEADLEWDFGDFQHKSRTPRAQKKKLAKKANRYAKEQREYGDWED